MNVDQKLALLRSEMAQSRIDAYIIPSTDPHNSEYVPTRWTSRTWISNFTGSAGVAVVTKDHAGVWTDSRYFLQAEDELSSSSFELHKVINQFAPLHIEWIKKNLPKNSTIGFDGNCMTQSSVNYLLKIGKECEFIVNGDHDLIEKIWTDRPAVPTNECFIFEQKYHGKSTAEKLKEIRAIMLDEKIDYHYVSTLDDIAWILNLRGNDVEFNPVFVAYFVIQKELSYLFINEQKLSDEIKILLKADNIELLPYEYIHDFSKLISKDQKVLIDIYNCNYMLASAIGGTRVHGKTISRKLKAIKNETEINHFRRVMAKDGAALTKAFKWLEEHIGKQRITEFDFSEKLASCRASQDLYIGESFPAIIGYKDNGAVIHYRPLESSAKEINAEGILLCDSGGQYLDGTTDITRTIALSEPTQEQQRNFTLVLKGMIALTCAKFPKGTTGVQLDTLARQFLWQDGLNYLHGTGHGVGFFMNVHEAPQGFAPVSSERGNTAHEVGMVSSNEPGYYKDGAYGIRIENLIVTIELEQGFLGHETLTMFPIDKKLMDLSILTAEEILWLNKYHAMVFEKISLLLDDDERVWLRNKCSEISI